MNVSQPQLSLPQLTQPRASSVFDSTRPQGFDGVLETARQWTVAVQAALDVLGPVPIEPFEPDQLADELLTR
jgi:hypothetical protein